MSLGAIYCSALTAALACICSGTSRRPSMRQCKTSMAAITRHFSCSGPCQFLLWLAVLCATRRVFGFKLQLFGGRQERVLTIGTHVAIRVPYNIAGSSWDAEEHGYVMNLLKICDQFAPGAQRTWLMPHSFPRNGLVTLSNVAW